jgi:AcrR family transcriptional regulator
MTSDPTVRARVLSAAFSTFIERGYAGASTLEIATRAKVSKRDLYALFDNKQAMLAACIGEQASRMRLALELPAPRDRHGLAATLVDFGTAILRGVCDPNALAVYRLAIAESEASAQIARALDAGRKINRAALEHLLERAQASGLIGGGRPDAMAAHFFGLLWGDLLVGLLLGVTDAPKPTEMRPRAAAAATALLTLYPIAGTNL